MQGEQAQSLLKQLRPQMKVKVSQPCPALCNPTDYTVHGILQARILEWVTVPFSRGSSQPRDQTQIFHIAGRFFTTWTTREVRKATRKVKEKSKKTGLKLSIQKTKIIASSPITSWEIDVETMKQWQIWFSWAPKITADDDCSHEIKKMFAVGGRAMANLDSI